MMGMYKGKKMQPIWEFFYKNVIGQSGTAGTLPSKREVGFTGVGFCERGEFSLYRIELHIVPPTIVTPFF